MMRPLRECSASYLHWVPVSSTRHELRAGSETVAVLQWEEPSGSAIGVAVEGEWSFRQAGPLKAVVGLRSARSETNLAMLVNVGENECKVEFCDGQVYWWRRPDWCSREWAFFGEDGRRLLRCALKWRLLMCRGYVEVEPGAASLPELSLLALLGWHALVTADRLLAQAGGLG